MEIVKSGFQPCWEKISFPTLRARDAHTSILIQDYIIVFGGYIEGLGALNEVFVYKIIPKTWQHIKMSGAIPSPRYSHSACLFQENKIIIHGGRSHNEILNDTYILKVVLKDSSLEGEWKIIKTKGDLAFCSGHTANIWQDKMYIFGGINSKNYTTNNLFILDLNDYGFTRYNFGEHEIPKERYNHWSAIHENKLYIFGGYSSKESGRLGDIWFLDLKRMKWQKVIPLGETFQPRSRAACEVYNGKLCIFGGSTSLADCTNETYSFDFESNVLKKVETKGQCPSGRHSTSLTSYSDNLIMISGNMKNDVAELVEEESTKNESLDVFILELEEANNKNKNKASLYKTDQNKFPKQIEESLFNELYSDIKFKIQDEIIPAHRIILSARCQFFQNMFTSGMVESNASIIEINDVSLPTFKAFLKFIYTSEVELTEELALELIEIANKYSQKELYDICENYLSEHLTLENFTNLASFAEKNELMELRQASINFVSTNLDVLEKSQERFKIPEFLVWDILFQVKNSK